MLVFVGIAGIIAWKELSGAARCKLALALERFGGSSAAACEEGAGAATGTMPSHLPYQMWKQLDQKGSVTLGYFTAGPLHGLSAPGQVRMPDTIAAMGKESKADQSYPLTQKQFDDLLVYIDDHKQSPYNYCTHNCTTWVADAVRATGIEPPSATFLGIASPAWLYSGIEAQKETQAARPGGCG